MTDKNDTILPTGAIYATLVRGRYHDACGKVWDLENGVATHPVTEQEAAYLTKHAVDKKTVDERLELIQKFEFSEDAPEDYQEAEGPEAEAKLPTPKVRRRAQAS